MRNKLLHIVLIFISLFQVNSLFAQLLNQAELEQTARQVKKHIKYLADDKLQGRLTGTKGEKLAYTYIIKQFKKIGITPKGEQGYLQPFSTKKNLANPHGNDHDSGATTITGHNVIGYLNHGAKYTVVIGAHYDHLGYNEFGHSTYKPESTNEKPQIHNGADDNASGTAALIELASQLKNKKYQQYNYLFIAFSGEEEGLLGSNYFTKHPTIDTSTIAFMINMDMVGRLDTTKNSFAISGTGTTPKWKEWINKVNSDLKVKTDDAGTGASDHTSFYYINIPALHFFTGTHYDYHKPSDDTEKINFTGTVKIIDYILQLVIISDAGSKPLFTPTAQDSSMKVSFKVTLGIMPDYLFDGKGVKIDGVTPNKPAALAGIKRGDILLMLGGKTVEDVKVYMKILQQYKKGDQTEGVILRNTEEIKITIQF